jgi:hypothetical protein
MNKQGSVFFVKKNQKTFATKGLAAIQRARSLQKFLLLFSKRSAPLPLPQFPALAMVPRKVT